MVLGCGIDILEVPALGVPEHPFVRARLTHVEPIEASHEPTALQFAAKGGNATIVNYLLDLGNIRSHGNETHIEAARAEAEANGYHEIAELLDKRGKGKLQTAFDVQDCRTCPQRKGSCKVNPLEK